MPEEMDQNERQDGGMAEDKNEGSGFREKNQEKSELASSDGESASNEADAIGQSAEDSLKEDREA